MWGRPCGAPQAESCQEDSGPGHYHTQGGQAHQGICEYRDRSEARGPSPLGMYEHPPLWAVSEDCDGGAGCQGLAWEVHTRLCECAELGSASLWLGSRLMVGWMVPLKMCLWNL